MAFITIVLVGSLLPSLVNELYFMKHSVSAFEVMCRWDALTWVAAALIVSFLGAVSVAHAAHFLVNTTREEQLRALAELLVVVGLFVAPRVLEPSFHMHHWYTAWLLALVCRLPVLWSRAAQALLIGAYINGIAVYGRDPVLACQAAFDLAYNEQCQFYIQCVVPPPPGSAPGTPGAPTTFTPPDWRTCDPGDYA